MEELSPHEMLGLLMLSLHQSSLDLFEGSVEVDPLYRDILGGELFSIAGFEGGASEDDGLVRVMPGLDGGAEAGEPGGAIAIIQGFSPLHFGFVGRAMEIIGINKVPAQFGGEGLANGTFAAAGDAHNDNNAPWLECHVA